MLILDAMIEQAKHFFTAVKPKLIEGVKSEVCKTDEVIM